MTVRRVECDECFSEFKIRITDPNKKFVRCPNCNGKISLQPKRRSHGAGKSRRIDSTSRKKAKPQGSSIGMWIGIGGGSLAVIVLLVVVIFSAGRQKPDIQEPLVESVFENQANKNSKNDHAINEKSGTSPSSTSKESTQARQNFDGTLILPVGSPPNAFSGSFSGESSPPKYLYKWEKGKVVDYKIDMKIKILDHEEKSTGSCEYEFKDKSSLGNFIGVDVDKSGGKATGTAFVVDPRGYLVTCAHVIEGAKDIHVILNGERFLCKVAAIHETEDLAILQIQKKDLHVVPLGNSDALELAEDVRVIGYPVSSLLGNELKVTSGTVSGIHHNTENLSRRIQVDASVNPGNSGGPVFDRHGNVIGIAVSKITSRTVTDVAFAVPVKLAIELLKKHKIGYVRGRAEADKTGPAIVKSSRSAIAFVEVSLGKEKSQNTEISYLMTIFTMHSRPVSGNRARSFFPAPPSHSFLTGDLLVSEYGELQDTRKKSGSSPLIAIGPDFFLERLPRNNIDTWEHEGLRFNRGGLFRFSVNYKVVSQSLKKLLLEKKYHMQSVGREGEPPKLTLDYDATIEFDPQQGIAVNCQAKGTAKIRAKGLVVSAPLTFSYHVKTEAEILAEKELMRKIEEERKKKAEPLNAVQRKNIIANLKTNDAQLIQKGLTVLQEKKPTSPDDEMAQIIAQLLKHEKNYIRTSALMTLQFWATPKVLPQIIRTMNKGNSATISSAIKVLGQLKTKESIAQLINLIHESQYRYAVQTALIEAGKMAERPVLQLLGEKSSEVRREACNILVEIGTPISLPALRKLISNDKDSLVKLYARQAIEKIESRM